MNPTVTPHTIKQLEQELETLARDQKRSYDEYTRLENETRDPYQVERYRARREGMERSYTNSIAKKRAELQTAREKLAAWQQQEEQQQATAAARAESLAKIKARRVFVGTNSEFEAAWPGLWKAIREREAVENATRKPPASTFRL